MLRNVAAFEFRYLARSPLAIASACVLFLGAFADMAGAKLLTVGGGNVLSNSPHALIVAHALVSLLFLFIGAAFVSDAVLRDDRTGFGPILRSTGVDKADYLFGRFIGAFAVGALVMAAATLGLWLGTLAPFADASLLGPNRWSGFAYGYGLFALPNALVIAAVLFALATSTRSTAGTFAGVVVLLVVYLVSQRLMENQPRLDTLRVLADPFGTSAYMAASRYLTAAELNAGAVPVTRLMLLGRVLWVALALALLGLTYARFRFAEAAPPRAERRRRATPPRGTPAVGNPPPALAALPAPRFTARTAAAQFRARVGMEARYVLRSAAFRFLLLVASAFALLGLVGASGRYGVAVYPLTSLAVPVLQGSFDTLMLIIAAYFGGELVWREREHGMDGIVDATPVPGWALVLPKIAGLAGVLVATLLVGAVVGLLVQGLDGAVRPAMGEYLRWYLLPSGIDALLLAVLAVVVQALAPGKHAGWGLMALFLVLRVFGPSLGLEHPLLVYGSTPAVPLSDMAGVARFATAAAWFRLFWSAVAVLLVVVAHRLWPRGADTRWRSRWQRMRAGGAGAGWMGAAAAALALGVGAWIVHNTQLLNEFRTAARTERYLAAYEQRYFRYAGLPQPEVRHVELDVALYPEEARADVRGRYTLVNATATPIEHLHLRLLNRDLDWVAMDIPGARLERDDRAFGYRIYRFDAAMRPGETRSLAFHTRRRQVGFRASGTDTSVLPNGSDLDSLELTPRVGMSDIGLIEDPEARRRLGLPPRQPLPRLGDLAATRVPPGGDLSWTTTDITVSAPADQTPVAPGRPVSERVEHGRRSVRFVSDTPIRNFFSVQSARYAVKRERQAGVEYAVYFHPTHAWNVDRMLRAMRASIAYYGHAFGPYPFDRARIVETPAYRDGAQAFAATVPMAETAGFAMDLRDPAELDMVSLVTAHEMAHQWWGQQVIGARMQGAGMLSETLAQYSALMVMKRLGGEADIQRYLRFQQDRYLGGRRTQVLAEQPLVGVEIGQDHVAYGKGALAMYLLQARIGEDAVNRALRRFVARYRFTTAPYPRSVDLVALLREEAKTPADRALVTDLFERITFYDLAVGTSTAVRRIDGAWDVTVPITAHKFHATGDGRETEAPLAEPIDVSLFAADPSDGALATGDVIRVEPRTVRSGMHVVRFVTARRPSYAGVDPDRLYIDRVPGDNVAAVADGAGDRNAAGDR